LWVAEAKAVLDAANALRLAATVVAHTNPKAALEQTRRAENLYYYGVADGAGNSDAAADAVKVWEEAHGGSMSDPAFRDKIYDVALKYRKMLEDRDAQAAARTAAQTKLTAARQAKTQQNLARTRRRGRPK
jgi:hypothetical protein